MNYRLGLLGHPVSHSLSPPMHEAAFRFFGINGTYGLLDVHPDVLQSRVAELIEEGYTGFNVTIPHKEAMFKAAAQHTEQAQCARAANTIKVENGQLVAHNTDIDGLRAALSQLCHGRTEFSTACIIGAGGATRAALLVLDELSIDNVFLIARDQTKAHKTLTDVDLRHRERVTTRSTETLALPAVQLVINATPIGQHNDELPDWISKILRLDGTTGNFYDMVYSRTEKPTPLVAQAASLGWNSADGKAMLVHQAAAAFEFWTGKRPPFEVMKDAFELGLKKSNR